MEIKFFKINEKREWDKELIEREGSFLQCWAWGDFQERLSKKVFRIEMKDEGLWLRAQIIKENLPFGISYFYIPFGPFFNFENNFEKKEKLLLELANNLVFLAKKERAIFLKIEPKNEIPNPKGFFISKKRIQPQKTLILDLKKDVKSLFESFSRRTKYGIRRSTRSGLELEIKEEIDDDFEVFFKLLKETEKRKKISFFPKKYYEELLKTKNEFLKTKLFLAKYQKKPVAAHLLVCFGNTVTYLHGAHDYEKRKLRASFFLHWQEILWAKENNFQFFDFWGIDEIKWPTLTTYKKGFGGFEFVYPPSQVFVFSNFWYTLYNLGKKLKDCFKTYVRKN